MRFKVLYNGKEVYQAETFAECYSKAILYGNGIFEEIAIIDTNTAEILCYIKI